VGDTLLRMALVFVPMVLSLSVHEFAHAWSAKKLGDGTAEGMGRLTLNPIAHADLMGTVVVPLGLALMGGGYFGWAKPVPVNPMNFSRKVTMRTGMMIVAAAGPISNVIQAIFGAGLLAAGIHSKLLTSPALQMLLVQYVGINIVLALFNMIPVGPLDGQKVLAGFLKGRAAVDFERFNAQYGNMGLMVVIVLLWTVVDLGPVIGGLLRGLLGVFGLRY
jgi:Zn-dependent protease